jgi:ubiquinone/menaquinone biosynthesis C-methylase UbiE
MPDISNFREIQTSTPWGHVLAEFATFCSPPAGAWSLDIGRGPGLLPAIFSKMNCTSFGVDLDLKLLQEHMADGMTQADAFRLPFGNEPFDLITSTNVFFLLPEPVAALKEWARTLKPKGMICMLNPSERLSIQSAEGLVEKQGLQGMAKESLLSWAGNAECHARWTPREMRDLLETAELELVESTLKVGPGFALFSRAEKRR